MRYQRPRIYPFYTNDVVGLQIFIQRTFGLDPGKLLFQVTGDKTTDLDAARLYVAVLYAVITDMHTVHDQDLAIIAGVCKYFLVAGHPGIETDLAGSCTLFAKSLAMVNGTVFQ